MHLDRRTFIGGSLAAIAVAACGGSDPAGQADRLGVRFPDGFRAPTHAVAGAGPQRFPFVIFAADGLPMTTTAPDVLEVEISFEDTFVETVTIDRRGTGQFTPYYPLVFTPPEAGRYVATPTFSDIGQEFLVATRDEVTLFQVGDTLPGFDTPTFSDARGVDPVCTRSEPCPFHEITLTEALSSGAPTALLIATPEFCQTDVCGPSVEFFIDAAASRDDLNFIHAEVFADPRSEEVTQFPEIAPLLAEWQLDFEPSLFVADATGTIVDIRHFAIDQDEMAEAIASV